MPDSPGPAAVAAATERRLTHRPATWAQALPGYGPTRILYSAGFTTSSPTTAAVVISLAWLAGLLLAAVMMFRRTAAKAAQTGS